MIPVTLTDLHLYLMGCECNDDLFSSGEEVTHLLKELVERSGLEPLKSDYHDFEGCGTTAVVLLAESHVAVHTWPETNHFVVVDISVCNYTGDNRKKTYTLKDLIIKAFKPTTKVVHEADPTPRIQEYNSPGLAYFAEIDQYIEKRKTRFQEMVLFRNRTLGKVLVLDNLFQTSETDEFFYHEPVIHPAMLTHENPRKVLILGGGDMGAAEEALKYPTVERLLQIDIDEEVVEICKKELGKIHKDCYKDPRFSISFEDGYEFMKRSDEKFDVLVLDLTDPVGVCERLYTAEFYRDLYENRMNPGAIVALHIGFPFTLPDRSKRIFSNLKEVFKRIESYTNFVPLYGDTMAFALCGDEINLLTPEEVDRKIDNFKIQDLNFICGGCYQGLFGIPVYIKRLLGI